MVHAVLRGKEGKRYPAPGASDNHEGKEAHTSAKDRRQWGQQEFLCAGNESHGKPRAVTGTRSINNFEEDFEVYGESRTDIGVQR